RNPCISIDFGTTLDGRITSDVARDDPNPFAQTIGNFCGLAGAIPDAIVRGTGLVKDRTGTALDLFGDHSIQSPFGGRKRSAVDEYVDWCHEHIDIRIVPRDRARFGRVPVCADVAAESGVALIGCDCGVDGSETPALEEIGHEIYEKHGMGMLTEVVDRGCAKMALRLIDVAIEKGM